MRYAIIGDTVHLDGRVILQGKWVESPYGSSYEEIIVNEPDEDGLTYSGNMILSLAEGISAGTIPVSVPGKGIS